ncbi:MAG: NFACT family protein [Oculatellaceae cyanobacterium Prado106]|nr:NFACT family protein [Oculatellaceae cyanobacterium Prado106]
MQPLDYTTLIATCAELKAEWLPARLEQVYQRDRYTLAIALRTLNQRGWLTVSWHPQAARICLGDAPPRTPDTFTFSQQLVHQVGNLALVNLEPIAPWERVVDFQFARRPGDPILWHLFVEIMGNYSNAILTAADLSVVTAAYQVGQQQSSVRSIQTGQAYEPPPRSLNAAPSLAESLESWQERVSLVPGALKRNLLQNYRGLSSALVAGMTQAAGLEAEMMSDRLTPSDWQRLFERWQEWLKQVDQLAFQPGWIAQGYTVTGWGMVKPGDSLQEILNRYYSDQLNQQDFVQLRHQIQQRLSNLLKKLNRKAEDFRQRLQQSDQADLPREQADLLMAYLHEWQPGFKQITLNDFATNAPVVIPLDPEKNAVQNAQTLYKRHQKLKRSRAALEPLLNEAQAEVDYLEQVQVAIAQLETYRTAEDLLSLIEIRDELVQQNYLDDPDQRYRNANPSPSTHFLRFQAPSGYEVLIGRNNRQNDELTFRMAGDYDLWFHTQEIPGSHVLLRLEPGAAPEDTDLQFTADLAAYYSRARQSDQVPVIYTTPKFVYKPKGAKPGIAIYKQETVIWGQPGRVREEEGERGKGKGERGDLGMF